MKITIESDIKGEAFEREEYSRVINMALVTVREGQMMPYSDARTHVNGPDLLYEMMGRLDHAKDVLLHGPRDDKG